MYKKLATIMFATIALCSAMFLCDVKAEAAVTPTMIGAQILEDKEGKEQALRIGMEINYEGATDFGMYLIKKSVLGDTPATLEELKSSGKIDKAVKVSYFNGADSIISVDANEKTLIYGVSIGEVMKKNYETEVVAIGYVTTEDGTAEASITRNVMDVAMAAGEFLENDEGSLIYVGTVREKVDLSKVSWEDKKASIIAGQEYEPQVSYNSEEDWIDLKLASSATGEEAQYVTFELDKNYDLSLYQSIIIKYANSDWRHKASLVYFDDGNNWIQYHEGDSSNMTYYGAVNADYGAADASVILNINNGVPYNEGSSYKNGLTVSKIRLLWPMNITKDNDTGKVSLQDLHIQSITFVKKGNMVRRTVDLSKAKFNEEGNYYDAEQKALVFGNLVKKDTGYHSKVANLEEGLTSTFNLNNYSNCIVKMKSVDVEGNQIDDKCRLIITDDGEWGKVSFGSDMELKADADEYTFINGRADSGNIHVSLGLNGPSPWTKLEMVGEKLIVTEVTFIQ